MTEDSRTAWRTSEAEAAFNAAWKLIEREERSPDDEAEMLVDAFASRYLWETVGEDEQRFTADWQVAHVASLVGEAGLALRFAALALARVEANGWTDWRLPSAFEGMARAHAAAGDAAGRDAYVDRCRRALAAVGDEDDRDLIAGQLASVPGIATSQA
jgi:hypothetical protein